MKTDGRSAIRKAGDPPGSAQEPEKPKEPIADPFGRLAAAEPAQTLEELVERRRVFEQQEVEERLRGPGCSCPDCLGQDRSRINWY
jgi:hypothetical protein